jgi:hypothetical protein
VQFRPGAFMHFAQRRLFRIDELTEQFTCRRCCSCCWQRPATSFSRIERQLSLG